jgi:biotin transport system permease protein
MISLNSPVKIWAHEIRASLKLLFLCLSTFLLFALKDIEGHLLGFLFVLVLYASGGRLFCSSGLKNIKPLWPFLALVVVWHMISGALEEGAVVVLRLISAVALANFVTMTTRLSDMMDVIRRLLSPLRRFGVGTHKLELCVALVIRFTPELARKGSLLTQSWRARSPKRPTWRVIMPFAVLAIDDADNLARALKARGGATQPMKE